MKHLATMAIAIFMALASYAQDAPEDLYLIFEFMRVPDEQGSNYREVEEFWSKLHKERIAAGKIIGWDLWSLTPSGSEQGSQYLTVTLFSSLESMMAPVTTEELMGYMQKAHPGVSEDELNAMMTKTVDSRDIAHQLYTKRIGTTTTPFDMKVGTMTDIGIMKQVSDEYEKAELEIFQPWHQQMVDAGEKGSWGLVRILSPSGSDAYATHMTFNMFKDHVQMAKSMESGVGDIDEVTMMAAMRGLETRKMREVKMARLEMMVR